MCVSLELYPNHGSHVRKQIDDVLYPSILQLQHGVEPNRYRIGENLMKVIFKHFKNEVF